jgi:glycosyltransferase involved in cell wall biosynthesis
MAASRIAHIGPAALPVGFAYGGAVERRMLELAKAQAERGDDVMIVSLENEGTARPAPDHGVRIHDVRCRTKRPVRDIELAVRARRVLREFRPDVVHVHNSPAAAAALRGVDAVTVLSFDYMQYRGTANPRVKAAYRRALQVFDGLLPVSEFCRSEAIDWWGLPASAFQVLPNGVNTIQFAPDPARRESARRRYGVDRDIVIGFVGRVCEQKGVDALVEAFRQIKPDFPAARLLVAGPANWFGTSGRTPLTDAIDEAGGRWLGAVPEHDLADVFRTFDICVLPTRQDEMFGMAAVEALASGTPVVCSDHGGLPEVVPSEAGRLVPPGDVAGLAAALAGLCADEETRRIMATAAPVAARRYAWPAVAQQADDIYRELARA